MLLHINKEGEIALVNDQELRHAKTNKQRSNRVRLDTEAMLTSSMRRIGYCMQGVEIQV